FLLGRHAHAVFAEKALVDRTDVVAKNGHTETTRPADHGLAHVTDTDHAERDLVQGKARNLLPNTGPHRQGHAHRVAGKAEHVAKRRVGYGFAESVRGVAKPNTQTLARLPVDRVDTGT